MVERRSKRSSDPIEALTLLLESQRRELGVQGLSVMTHDGILLATSKQRGRLSTAPVATWELQVDGEKLVIQSIGGRLSHDVGEGVRRIAQAPG